MESSVITSDDIRKHIDKEVLTIYANHGVGPDGTLSHFTFEQTYSDIIEGFSTKNRWSVFQVPVSIAVCLCELTIVPLRAIPWLDAFVSYYGCTPDQLATLENEGLVQTMLTDPHKFYLACGWFDSFVSKRFGGLPPLDRMAAISFIAFDDFRKRVQQDKILGHIEQLGEYFLEDATTKLCLISPIVPEAPFERFLNLLKDTNRFDPNFKRILVDVAFYATVAPELRGLGAVPNFDAEILRLQPMFEAFQTEGDEDSDPNFNLLRTVLWEALPLQVPRRIESVKDILSLHADGIPKLAGEALSALTKEHSDPESSDANLNNLCIAAQEKIKEANKEFLRLRRSWKGSIIDAALEVGQGVSPIGMPFRETIKDFVRAHLIPGSEFTRKWVALKWRLYDQKGGNS